MTRPRSIALYAVLAAIFLATPLSDADPPPLPSDPGWRIDAPMAYTDDADAQAAWRPIEEAMSPAEFQKAGPRGVVRLPLRFRGNDLGRNAWDGKMHIDASGARALCMRLYCDEPLPSASLTIYLKSGQGYYWAKPPQPEPGAWREVRIARMEFGAEGKPGPWGEICEVRVSPWRGTAEDGALYVADIGVEPGDKRIAVLRNDRALHSRKGDAARALTQYASTAARFLDEMGIEYAVLSDMDLDDRALEGVEILIVPYAPDLAESDIRRLEKFIAGGGKYLGFYGMPAAIYRALGMRRRAYVPLKGTGREVASIRAVEGVVSGMPDQAAQHSWNLHHVEPIGDRAQVAAWWHAPDGARTEWPAVLVSPQGASMTHILLSEDPGAKKRLLLALLGPFAPEVWQQAASHAVDRAGRVGDMPDLDTVEKRLAETIGPDAARQALAEARDALDGARRALSAKRYEDALAATADVGEAARLAWCAGQRPRPGEKRAFWCHFPYGPTGMTWEESARILAENGFNILAPNTLWGGVAYYPSEVLPVAPEVVEKGDAMRLCLDACRRHNIECHAWKVHWRIHKGPKAFQKRMAEQGRVGMAFDGTPSKQWLCPSHPANRKMEVESMVEVARNYEIDGVHSDYIRYPDPDHCFCPTCRATFEQQIGRKVVDWPADVRTDEALARAWDDFRRERITTLVADIRQALDALPRKVQYSAAVFPNWPLHRREKAQDWKVWCDRGYLDFVCPMDYREDNAAFRQTVKSQLEWAGKTPMLPGIGLTTWSDRTDAVRTIEQIRIARELGTAGFTIFHLDTTEAKRVVPLLGLGITRP